MRISITSKTEQLLAEAMLVTGIGSPDDVLAIALKRSLPEMRQWFGDPAVTPPPSTQPSEPTPSFTGEGLEPISL